MSLIWTKWGRIRRLVSALLAFIFLSAGVALTEGGEHLEQALKVQIRMVKALGGKPAENPSGAEQGKAESYKRIDRRLEDISSKLEHLPFDTFQLVSNEERNIACKKKQVFQVGGGQVVYLRPLYLSDNKAGLWVRWEDGGGTEILDTRMHFDKGESVIAGTESEPGGGTMLVVNVSPLN